MSTAIAAKRLITTGKQLGIRMVVEQKQGVHAQGGHECPTPSGFRTAARRVAAVVSLAALVSLSACGGGGGGVTFDIGVVVAGQPIPGVVVQPGGAQSVTMSAGQSIELDASEPVVWTLEVGGSAVTGTNTSVYFQGVTITETALSPSRIALDTSASFLLPNPVPITLTAVSTYDAALVATVNVLIAN